MPFHERKAILEALSDVDEVFEFDDSDGSCIHGLNAVKQRYPNDDIIFCNGGDRTQDNIPELVLKDIRFKFQVGGNFKKNSSSNILQKWTQPIKKRKWGEFSVLLANGPLKVKELTVLPGQGMSFQRHALRSEILFVASGECSINYSTSKASDFQRIDLKEFSSFLIESHAWHQIFNISNKPCRIIEIQYGEAALEEDIERLCIFPDTP